MTLLFPQPIESQINITKRNIEKTVPIGELIGKLSSLVLTYPIQFCTGHARIIS